MEPEAIAAANMDLLRPEPTTASLAGAIAALAASAATAAAAAVGASGAGIVAAAIVLASVLGVMPLVGCSRRGCGRSGGRSLVGCHIDARRQAGGIACQGVGGAGECGGRGIFILFTGCPCGGPRLPLGSGGVCCSPISTCSWQQAYRGVARSRAVLGPAHAKDCGVAAAPGLVLCIACKFASWSWDSLSGPRPVHATVAMELERSSAININTNHGPHRILFQASDSSSLRSNPPRSYPTSPTAPRAKTN